MPFYYEQQLTRLPSGRWTILYYLPPRFYGAEPAYPPTPAQWAPRAWDTYPDREAALNAMHRVTRNPLALDPPRLTAVINPARLRQPPAGHPENCQCPWCQAAFTLQAAQAAKVPDLAIYYLTFEYQLWSDPQYDPRTEPEQLLRPEGPFLAVPVCRLYDHKMRRVFPVPEPLNPEQAAERCAKSVRRHQRHVDRKSGRWNAGARRRQYRQFQEGRQ